MIRKATIKDLNFISKCNLALASETEQLELDQNVVLAGVRQGLEGKAQYLIAERNEQNAGQLMLTTEWSDWRNCEIWWIQSVYVLPKFRNQGVYKELYQYTLNMAKANKIGGIRLYVDLSNLKAAKVYETLGMDGNHYKLFETLL